MGTGAVESSAVVGIVLAAGAGRRMGGPKALLRLEGEPLVARAVRTALLGGCGRVVAVLGSSADSARPIAEAAGAHVVVNTLWREGMGASLRAGLATAARVVPEAKAALVMLVDQPYITSAAVSAVLGARQNPDDAADLDESILAAAAYDGRRGHPVLLGRAHWDAIRPTLTGDAGARAYLSAHRDEIVLVPCDALADPRDLDVPGDLPPEHA